MKKTLSTLVALFVLLLASVAHAGFTPPAPDSFVSDTANKLSPSTRTELESTLTKLEQETSVEFAVAIVPTTSGTDLESAALKTFNSWKIGKADKNNGVLLFIDAEKATKAGPNAKRCGCLRVQTGRGIGHMLTDQEAGNIMLKRLIKPVLKGDYNSGVKSTVFAIDQHLRAKISNKGKKRQARKSQDESPSGTTIIIVMIVGVFIIVLLITFLDGGGGGSGGGFARNAYARYRNWRWYRA